MPPPAKPKIYHIVHIDRLASIVADACLWSDAQLRQHAFAGTTIGMNDIKSRRLTLPLASHPQLTVGQCVPFYFCPRSVMLYVIHRANHESLSYRGGQQPIVHLEADLHDVVDWATANSRRWAFTASNAGSFYFDDYSDLDRLDELDWASIHARNWQNSKEGKQAEFLIERSFPWPLVSHIAAMTEAVYNQVFRAIQGSGHRPTVTIQPRWYY